MSEKLQIVFDVSITVWIILHTYYSHVVENRNNKLFEQIKNHLMK